MQVPLVVAGIDSDRLYPLHTQAFVAEHQPGEQFFVQRVRDADAVRKQRARRRPVPGHDIGEQAGFQAADLAVELQRLRIAPRGGVQQRERIQALALQGGDLVGGGQGALHAQ